MELREIKITWNVGLFGSFSEYEEDNVFTAVD